jgi:hypothetical protein
MRFYANNSGATCRIASFETEVLDKVNRMLDPATRTQRRVKPLQSCYTLTDGGYSPRSGERRKLDKLLTKGPNSFILIPHTIQECGSIK